MKYLGAFDRRPIRAGDIGRLVAFLTFNNVKDDLLAIANRSQEFLWVIFDNRRLMDEDIFVRIVAMDESVPITDVEPFHLAGDVRRQHFALILL